MDPVGSFLDWVGTLHYLTLYLADRYLWWRPPTIPILHSWLAWTCDAIDFFSVSLSVNHLATQFGRSTHDIVRVSFLDNVTSCMLKPSACADHRNYPHSSPPICWCRACISSRCQMSVHTYQTYRSSLVFSLIVMDENGLSLPTWSSLRFWSSVLVS